MNDNNLPLSEFSEPDKSGFVSVVGESGKELTRIPVDFGAISAEEVLIVASAKLGFEWENIGLQKPSTSGMCDEALILSLQTVLYGGDTIQLVSIKGNPKAKAKMLAPPEEWFSDPQEYKWGKDWKDETNEMVETNEMEKWRKQNAVNSFKGGFSEPRKTKAQKKEEARRDGDSFRLQKLQKDGHIPLPTFDEGVRRFETILQDLGRDIEETNLTTKKWMYYYDLFFNFYCECTGGCDHQREEGKYTPIVEKCMELLLNFCMGKPGNKRKTIQKLFGYWWREHTFIFRGHNVNEDFMILTQMSN